MTARSESVTPGEVKLKETWKPVGHPAKHGGAGPGSEAAALRTLKAEPALTDEPEQVPLLLLLQPREHSPKLVVGKGVIDADPCPLLLRPIPSIQPRRGHVRSGNRGVDRIQMDFGLRNPNRSRPGRGLLLAVSLPLNLFYLRLVNDYDRRNNNVDNCATWGVRQAKIDESITRSGWTRYHVPVLGFPPLGPRKPRALHEFVIVLSRNSTIQIFFY
ncbi:hypothetical protein MUK42_19885 [Musa troglodytarum]|uniref:Uncharacterized protein n=1 Tax=Musa troglodytarum TaxID=320322 RepID=A0A9E7FXE3_9LILI|nr:hypothetical protein MUK42_19885 [Musa troglodytarum]